MYGVVCECPCAGIMQRGGTCIAGGGGVVNFGCYLLLLGLGWCVVVVRCAVVVFYPLRRTDRARLGVHDISL